MTYLTCGSLLQVTESWILAFREMPAAGKPGKPWFRVWENDVIVFLLAEECRYVKVMTQDGIAWIAIRSLDRTTQLA